MALTICPECGATVSDTASCCPHCGCLLNGKPIGNSKFNPYGVKDEKTILKRRIIFGLILSVMGAPLVMMGLIFMRTLSNFPSSPFGPSSPSIFADIVPYFLFGIAGLMLLIGLIIVITALIKLKRK